MEIVFTAKAMEDLDYWKKSGNKLVLQKIRSLLESTLETPFIGIGKPELLKFELAGCWSRRINQEHRLIYEIDAERILVLSCKGHY
jgi:toxin YoeB